MKYEIELKYDIDKTKTLLYDDTAKAFKMFCKFFVITKTRYDKSITNKTKASDFSELDYTTDYEIIYNEIVSLLSVFENFNNDNVKLDASTFNINIKLLLLLNVNTTSMIYTNMPDDYMKLIYDGNLEILKQELLKGDV